MGWPLRCPQSHRLNVDSVSLNWILAVSKLELVKLVITGMNLTHAIVNVFNMGLVLALNTIMILRSVWNGMLQPEE